MSATRRTFLATGAAFAASSQAAFAQTVPHVVVGSSTIDAASALLSAQHNGYFTKNGLDVEIIQSNGAASAAAIAGGTMQFAASNIVTLIKAHLQGIGFLMVAPSSMYVNTNPTQVLCTRTDSGFKTAADLNGKTIAVTAIGDLLSTSTWAWIAKNGGDASTVKLVEFPPAAQATALEAGRVQGATLAEPFLSEALGTGTVRVFGNIFDAIAPSFLVAAYFGNSDWMKANPETVRRFALSMLQGSAFANAHPDQTLPWLVEFAKLDPAVVKRSRREHFGTSMDPAAIQTEIDALARIKVIDHSFDARDMISPVVANLRA
jgi:NitT/TauT family transport system substrate-binding protein